MEIQPAVGSTLQPSSSACSRPSLRKPATLGILGPWHVHLKPSSLRYNRRLYSIEIFSKSTKRYRLDSCLSDSALANQRSCLDLRLSHILATFVAPQGEVAPLYPACGLGRFSSQRYSRLLRANDPFSRFAEGSCPRSRYAFAICHLRGCNATAHLDSLQSLGRFPRFCVSSLQLANVHRLAHARLHVLEKATLFSGIRCYGHARPFRHRLMFTRLSATLRPRLRSLSSPRPPLRTHRTGSSFSVFGPCSSRSVCVGT